jgi:hypothetical protein
VFKRHKDNKSYYQQSEKIIYWTLEFKIVIKENDVLKNDIHTIVLHGQVNENLSLKDIIENFAQDKTKYYSNNHLFMNEIKDKLSQPEKIAPYIEKPHLEEFKNLITPKQPGSGGENTDLKDAADFKLPDDKYDLKVGNVKLVSVDRVKSLKEALENTIVYEYPSIYLVI